MLIRHALKMRGSPEDKLIAGATLIHGPTIATGFLDRFGDFVLTPNGALQALAGSREGLSPLYR